MKELELIHIIIMCIPAAALAGLILYLAMPVIENNDEIYEEPSRSRHKGLKTKRNTNIKTKRTKLPS